MQSSGPIRIHVIVKYDRKNIHKVYKESRKVITYLQDNIVRLNRSGKFIIITLVDKNNKENLSKLKKKKGIARLPAMVCDMYKQKLYGFGAIRTFLMKISSHNSIQNVGKHLMGANEEIHSYQMSQMQQAGVKTACNTGFGMMNDEGMINSGADALVKAQNIGNARADGVNMSHRGRQNENFGDPRNRHKNKNKGRIYEEDNAEDEYYEDNNKKSRRGQIHMQPDDPASICAAQGGQDSDLMAGFWESNSETKLH